MARAETHPAPEGEPHGQQRAESQRPADGSGHEESTDQQPWPDAGEAFAAQPGPDQPDVSHSSTSASTAVERAGADARPARDRLAKRAELVDPGAAVEWTRAARRAHFEAAAPEAVAGDQLVGRDGSQVVEQPATVHPPAESGMPGHRPLAEPADHADRLGRPTARANQPDGAPRGGGQEPQAAVNAESPLVAQTVAPGAGAASPRRAGRRLHWLLILVLAGALGVLTGVGLVLRGQSFGPSASAVAGARPTLVIGAPVSPVPIGSPSAVAAPQAPAAAEYVVQSGDTLRSIALSVYGDADQWPRIYDANRQLIGPNPDALQEGMRLHLP